MVVLCARVSESKFGRGRMGKVDGNASVSACGVCGRHGGGTLSLAARAPSSRAAREKKALDHFRGARRARLGVTENAAGGLDEIRGSSTGFLKTEGRAGRVCVRACGRLGRQPTPCGRETRVRPVPPLSSPLALQIVVPGRMGQGEEERGAGARATFAVTAARRSRWRRAPPEPRPAQHEKKSLETRGALF